MANTSNEHDRKATYLRLVNAALRLASSDGLPIYPADYIMRPDEFRVAEQFWQIGLHYMDAVAYIVADEVTARQSECSLQESWDYYWTSKRA